MEEAKTNINDTAPKKGVVLVCLPFEAEYSWLWGKGE
jgi:hypothetical protein